MRGEIVVDESYFAGVRKGKRGRGSAGKVAVFGLLKRGGIVFIVVVPNAKSKTLLPLIEENVNPAGIVFTDSFKAYDALGVTALKHMQINHSKLFADRGNHIKPLKTSGVRPSGIFADSLASSPRASTGS